MKDSNKVIEELKTEITGLKVRLRRIENFLLEFPNPGDSISHSGELDDLFNEAVEIIHAYERASASLLQKRLGIGYARAARLLDELENAGFVSSSEGSEPRKVFKNRKSTQQPQAT